MMDTSLRSLLVFIILVPVFTVWISTLVWVWRDAERCGKPGILVALLVGLLCWPVGLLVWLILRQNYLAQALPAAAAVPPLLPPGNCPQCGRAMAAGSMQGLCPACLLRQAAFESVAPGPGMAGFTPPAPEELAELFPQFESLEWLGKGGMGAVYKAKQTSLDRFVALKILPAEAAEDPAFGERFQREARALAQLSHPNIVGVHDFGQAGAYAYLVMEFVDGANLRQLQRGGHLSPREALAIVPQICEALQFAHDRGIVHRDIKPENILIDTQGRVKIADFGLAKLMRTDADAPDLTLTRHAVGTPQYMAPEQIEKPETVDHRADIYSLGVVFYEMLTGELPIGRFPSPSQRVEVDVRLDEVVLKALEKEPSLRYQQASALKTRVETVAGGTAAASVSGTDDPTNQPPVWNDAARPAVVPHHTQAANAPAVPVHPPSPAVPPVRQKNSRWWSCLQLVLGSAFLFLSYMILNRVFGMARDELFSLVFAVVGLALVAVGTYNAVKERWWLPQLVLGPAFLLLSYMVLNGVFGMARDELFSLVFAAVGLVLVIGGVFWVWIPDARQATNQLPSAPPTSQKRSGCWLLLAILLVVPVLVGIALAAVFSVRPASPKPLKDPVPLVVNLEIRNPSTNIVEQVNLFANQRAFTDIIRLPHASYTVAGAVWQHQGGGYTLDVSVRNHPDGTSSGGIDTGSVGIKKPVTAGVPYRVGKLQDDEFFVTLTRAGEPAAPVTETPVQLW